MLNILGLSIFVHQSLASGHKIRFAVNVRFTQMTPIAIIRLLHRPIVPPMIEHSEDYDVLHSPATRC